MQETEYIWRNGEMIKWGDATVHVMAHGLHYGTSFFEGIRAYETQKGTCIFRLTDHIKRLEDSAKIYGIALPFDVPSLSDACKQVIRDNDLTSAYIRPIAFIGYGVMSVCPKEFDIDVAIAAFPWGEYLGDGALDQGVDVCISTWNRVAPNTVPASAKAGGNYLSGFLIGKEAQDRGFVEGIGLGVDGLISEGAGENLFVIKDGVIYTPPAASSILCGITRDTVIKLAQKLGYEIKEQTLPREMLYLADEIFMTGTAAEITPVRSVDRNQVGEGKAGEITKSLQHAFFGLFNGETKDEWGWLEPVSTASKQENAA